MATLGSEKFKLDDGTTTTTYRVLFVDPTGKRQTIRLGKLPKKAAELVKLKVESLLAAKLAGHPLDAQTAGWLGEIGDSIHEKLAKAGLVEPRQEVEVEEWTLGRLVDEVLASRDDVARRTSICYRYTKKKLLEFFTAGRLLSTIRESDADEYRRWLLTKHAQATASREVKRARQFFKVALRRRLIAANPFTDVKAGTQTNPSRKHFVSRETIEAVIAACPNNDWRLIFALARYAGLRTPSELQELKWSDVNWERQRFTVQVPKKAHIAGHETRVVPIFAELRPHLERAFDEAEKGAVYVAPRARGDVNLRTYAHRILKNAGVAVWPKLFNNLRASCEIELMRRHPAHLVHEWIGHSARVAEAHYLQATDADYEAAAGGSTPAVPDSNPAHYPAHSGAVTGHLAPAGLRQTREKRGVAESGDGIQYSRQESNNRRFSRRKPRSAELPATLPGTLHDADLAELVRVLAGLTPEERSALLALAQGLRTPAG